VAGIERDCANAKGSAEEAALELERALEEERQAIQKTLFVRDKLEERRASLERFANCSTRELAPFFLARKSRTQQSDKLAALEKSMSSVQAELSQAEDSYAEAEKARSEAKANAAKHADALWESERRWRDEEKERGGAMERASRERNLQDLVELIRIHEAEARKLIEIEKEIDEEGKDGAGIYDEMQRQRSRAELLAEQRSNAQERKERELRLSRIEEFRCDLHIGEACPLCEQPVSSIPRAVQGERLRAATEALKITEEEHDKTRALLVEFEKKHERHTAELKQRRKDRDRLLSDAKQRRLDYENRRSELSQLPEDLDALSLETVEKLREEAHASRHKLRELKGAWELLNKQSQDWIDEEKAAIERLGKLAEIRAGLRAQLEARANEIRSTETELEAARHEERERLAQLADEVGEDVPDEEGEEVFLSACRQGYRAFQELSEVLTEYRAEIESHESELLGRLPSGTVLEPESPESESTPALLKVLAPRLRDRAKLSRHAADEQTKAEAKAAASRKSLDAAQEELGEAEKALEIVMANLGIDDLELARAKLRSSEQRAALRKKRDALSHAMAQAEIVLAERRKDVVRARDAFGEDAPPERDKVSELLRALEQQISELAEERGRCKSSVDELARILLEDRKSREKLQRYAEEQQKLETELARVGQLSELIGDSKGAKFRELAQSLTLDALVQHANHRLRQFAPRYALQRRDMLDLEVLDRDLADELRPVTTLSGGESFLVSLALAIALSDMKRGQADIGSVFIDEGFGSLDQDSLELALAALEEVQNQLGAQLVVISHVGDLQSRWQDRVEVRRISRGRSWLVVPGGPERPGPEDAPALPVEELPFDMDAVVELLAKHPEGISRNKIAKELGIDASRSFTRALKSDPRIEPRGRLYALVGV
jgi:exonuclease SbcC